MNENIHAPEVRSIVVDGVRQVYEAAGEGPVCLVHSGGPGIHPGYLRIPALERHLTMVYLHPVGAGESGLLPDGDYSLSRYGYFAEAVLEGAPHVAAADSRGQRNGDEELRGTPARILR